MKKFSAVFAAVSASLLLSTTCLASSFATPPFQVNTIPGGYYGFIHAMGQDPGSGKFTILWDEDRLFDTDGDPYNDGLQVYARTLQVSGGAIAEYKPTVRVDQSAAVGEKLALGFFKTTSGALRTVWNETVGGQDVLYWQSFVDGTKSGGIVPLTAPRSERQVNIVVNGRSDGVGALISTPMMSYGTFTGKLVTAAGSLGAAVNFSMPAGWIIGCDGVGKAFTALASWTDATITNWKHQGRSFNGNFVPATAAPSLAALSTFTKLPIVGFTGRNDGKAVFFKVVRNSTGKYDLVGRVYGWNWTAPAAPVKIVSNVLDPEGGYIAIARLAGGGLMVAYQKVETPGQHSVVLQRLSASLGKVGTAVKVGPIVGQTWFDIFPLSTGKVIVDYNVNNALYVRAVNP